LTPYILAMAAMISVATLAHSQAVSNPRTERHNVLLLTVDTLRADRLGVYGRERNTSPNMDALLKKGIRFTNAYTTEPLTAPAFASLFTSRYPHETGCTRNGLSLRRDFITLPEIMKTVGYDTAAILSNWPLKAHLSKLDRGFDYYDDEFHKNRNPLKNERDARDVTDLALEWLEGKRNKKKPFFLWAHYSDPHSPYEFREQFEFPVLEGEKFKSPGYRYDTEVAYADHHIGRLLGGMRKMGLLGNTLIIFLADHGESLGEHGYFGHGRQVYEPMLRIPMGVVGPSVREGVVTSEPAQILDVLPTVLHLLGLDPLKGARGEALVERGGAPRKLKRKELYFETYRGAVPDLPGAKKLLPGDKPLLLGVMKGKWKCIYNYREKSAELYNLAEDPREIKDLSPVRRKMTRHLVEDVGKWFNDVRPYVRKKAPTLSEKDREKLRALGYLQ